jgi:hypothetical protein
MNKKSSNGRAKKIHFNRETLRSLQAEDYKRVMGGGVTELCETNSGHFTCPLCQ